MFFVWDKLEWLNWFWQFLCEGLSSFNSKGFYYSYAWSCSLCEGRTFYCMGLISRKLCRFLFMFSTGFMSFSVLILFPLPIILFIFMHSFWFYFIWNRWGSLNPSIFVDFNVHHKAWLTYSGGTDKPGELCYNFSISNKLTQMVNLPARMSDCNSFGFISFF